MPRTRALTSAGRRISQGIVVPKLSPSSHISRTAAAVALTFWTNLGQVRCWKTVKSRTVWESVFCRNPVKVVYGSTRLSKATLTCYHEIRDQQQEKRMKN